VAITPRQRSGGPTNTGHVPSVAGRPASSAATTGPELSADALKDWCRFSRAVSAHIDPCSPWQNPTESPSAFGSRTRFSPSSSSPAGPKRRSSSRSTGRPQRPPAPLAAEDDGPDNLDSWVANGQPMNRYGRLCNSFPIGSSTSIPARGQLAERASTDLRREKWRASEEDREAVSGAAYRRTPEPRLARRAIRGAGWSGPSELYRRERVRRQDHRRTAREEHNGDPGCLRAFARPIGRSCPAGGGRPA
jgi:hypothetical protein